VLSWIMMEAVGTRDDVEGARSEGKALAVSLHGKDMLPVQSPPWPALTQHLGDQIDGVDPSLRHSSAKPACKYPGSAAHIEDLDRLVSRHLADPANQDSMGGPEQQPLQDATVVTVTPAREFRGCLVLVVSHVQASLPSFAGSSLLLGT